MSELYDLLRDAIIDERPVVLVTVIEGPNTGAKLAVELDGSNSGTLGNLELDRVVGRDAVGELEAGRSGVRHYGVGGQTNESDLSVFIESFASPPIMLVFGAVDFTAALARAGKLLGFNVVMADPRAMFATVKRFPMVDKVFVAWPDEVFDIYADRLGPNDAVCILTHDPKFDVLAVQRALATDVGYIGVMGSRRTHAVRLKRLSEAGVTPVEINRLMAPIGLDIGSRTPEEVAVSVCAEIIANRTGHAAPSLRDGDGTIHRVVEG
ncbi:MAG: sulfurylase large subunit [Acidimicrobiia bacterium]|nr:sulfurylase large subunit [Acidimicrobiia bacterium]MYC57862.1 sulfurylase large subunit [Acidimicrobiia bacterium]MYG94763.1 sulfurylase large subunit [Acidimicrobiia bacterium]MYI30231.1 sulfurylase large subunit [Acidimicrobiia bacterium]